MITLALDLAGTTGYGIEYDTGEVKAGLWILTRGNLGGRRSPIPMLRLWHRLNRLGSTHQIDRVVYEETFGRGDAKNRLDSLQHCTTLWCLLNQIPFIRASPSEWKKAVLGTGRANRQEYYAAAIQRFPSVDVWKDDIAAALWLLTYAKRFDQTAD